MAIFLTKRPLGQALLGSLFLSALMLQGCATLEAEVELSTADAWVTTGDKTMSFEKTNLVTWVNANSRTNSVELSLQGANPLPFYGVGAAMTHASAWLVLQSEQPDDMIDLLFSKDKGAGLDLVRIPIGSSDFPAPGVDGKIRHTSFSDLDLFEEDKKLEKFSIAEDERTIIPVLKKALAVNPDLKIMAAPWSPPSWMKDSQSMRSGRLKVEYYGVYADYLVKFIQAYGEHGIQVSYLSLQNEPHHTSGKYPTNIMLAIEQAMFVNQFLLPRLKQNNLDIQLVLWDHNAGNFNARAYEELAKYPIEVLDSFDEDTVSQSVVGFHCYESDGIDSLSVAYQKVHDKYPTVEVHNTECSGGGWAPNYKDNLDWNMKTLYLGTPLHGGSSVIYWNAVLDENAGPKLGGCHNCDGMLTAKDSGDVQKELHWFVSAHIGKFARGNVGDGMTVYPLKGNFSTGISGAVFENKSGSRFVVLHNSANAAESFSLKLDGKKLKGLLYGHSVMTVDLQ